MQQMTSAASWRVILQGGWTMNEAAERQKFLVDELCRCLGADPRPARGMVDLSGVTEIDACGCQLLALFLEHLKEHGIALEPCCIPPELEDTISLLGFTVGFAGCAAPGKESL
jgi:anti-anti-sigma regulatory factor